jgi:uncharacterized protein YndB with AHSA1/START domain
MADATGLGPVVRKGVGVQIPPSARADPQDVQDDQDAMTETSGPDRITRSLQVHASIDRVWDVLTRPDHIQCWYAFGGAEIDLRVGGRVAFRWDEHGRYLGVIEAVDPGRRLAFRFVPHAADVEPTVGNSTLVEFHLAPTDAAVALLFSESGYRSLAMSEEEQRGHLSMSEGAWDDALRLLKECAEGSPD